MDIFCPYLHNFLEANLKHNRNNLFDQKFQESITQRQYHDYYRLLLCRTPIKTEQVKNEKMYS